MSITLEHAGEPYGGTICIGEPRGNVMSILNSSIRMVFQTYVSSLRTQNDILDWKRPISSKTLIVQHLRPRCHITENMTFG